MKHTPMLLLAAGLLTGCATTSKQTCVALRFATPPPPSVAEALANTQAPADHAAILKWLATDKGFLLSGAHTNEIAWAASAGATVTVIHESGGTAFSLWGKQ